MSTRTGNTPTPPLLTEPGRSSPPPSCVICLGPFKNKSFTETCLHQFCFDCLVRWSKIKAECPLCKQPFKSIIHSVRSNDSYDKYDIAPPVPSHDLGLDEVSSEISMTTLTLHPRDNMAIQHLLLGFPTDTLPSESSLERSRSVSSSNSHVYRFPSLNIIFRRTIYHRNMWACPLPDVTGRFRDCSPDFYMNNPAQINRLVPWINRELSALSLNQSSASYSLTRITSMLTNHAINSRAFRDFMSLIIPSTHTEQFVHELFSFARSPYDMIGYDRSVSYQTGSPYVVDNFVNEISSSEEDSSDSDVFLVTSEPGPSNSTNQSYTPKVEASSSNNANSRSLGSPVVIESISHSDTDDSSDEVIIMEKKPEIVDLVASDSDAVIIDELRPSTPSSLTVELSDPETPSTSGVVKFRLKRRLSRTISVSDTESDNNFTSNKKKLMKNKIFRKNITILRENASTENTDRDTDSSSSSSSSSQFSNSSQIQSSRSRKVASFSQKKSIPHLETDSESNEQLNSKEKHDSKLNKIDQDHSNSSNSQHSHSARKQKRKKLKRKKPSKKNLDYSIKKKHKHKSKSKKRSKSNDKPLSALLGKKSKGKFCSKSKIKNRPNLDSTDESVVDFQPPNYLPRIIPKGCSTSQETRTEKKTLKSVVNPPQPEVQTNLLDLMSNAVLSSKYPILSINNKYSTQNNHELSQTIDIDKIIENSQESQHSPLSHAEPLDLRTREDSDD
ncbi:uncharacterized protein LOC143918066 isoform X2 [Arctopsyche grandis]|uniref:uncharacterized protein LOC143918066 isoform X2 n=1 Tax=Arctopsyche grandis TaxID=121162 RepID=UPI00406D64DD